MSNILVNRVNTSGENVEVSPRLVQSELESRMECFWINAQTFTAVKLSLTSKTSSTLLLLHILPKSSPDLYFFYYLLLKMGNT